MTTQTQTWQRADAAHFLHPFTDHKALAAKGTRVIVKADNLYLWDSEGSKIFDAMSGLWCVNVGYGQKALIDAAAQQMAELPFYNAFFQTATPPPIELAAKLVQLAPPGFERVFFTSSGSEGNDTIIRMVRRYWDIEGQPQRKILIGRINGYHGSTMAGASLGGMAAMHEQGGLPIPDVHHIQQPHAYTLRGPGESDDDFGLRAASWLEAKILELGPERVAAFIGEPVQGAGGVIVPPRTYWPEIERICRQYGILLVSDEVICGFGRTGQWWGCQTQGFSPDLITFAKGVTSGYIPLGGVLVGQRVSEALFERGGEFEHGFTYSGHPTACAVALANLALIEREGLVERVAHETGPYLAQRFNELRSHPLVADVQACGLMAALQLAHEVPEGSASLGMTCRKHCFANGLIMRAVGDRMIVAPPLIMTLAQVDELVGLVRHCLDLTLAEILGERP